MNKIINKVAKAPARPGGGGRQNMSLDESWASQGTDITDDDDLDENGDIMLETMNTMSSLGE
jgi:hypothetical protein